MGKCGNAAIGLRLLYLRSMGPLLHAPPTANQDGILLYIMYVSYNGVTKENVNAFNFICSCTRQGQTHSKNWLFLYNAINHTT